jgi:imidazolonepropionase-like amidohydrolase
MQIRAGWLIDGTGGAIQKDVVLNIADGIILSVHQVTGNTVLESGAPGVEILDLSDCTVLPGLIDSHVHMFMSGTADRKIRDEQLDADFHKIEPVIAKHIKQLLKYGVVAVRDGGDKNGHALRFKQECLDSLGAPMEIKAAGRAWHSPNRYGRLIGRIPKHGGLGDDISKETEPIDHVKVVNSGLNSLLCFGRQTAPQFSLEEMQHAVQAAADRGWGVMVHANGQIPVQIAVDSGCRSIEHGFFMGEENLKKMADNRIFWVPTAFTMKAYAQHFAPTHPDMDVPRRNLDHQIEQMALAGKLEVPMAVGTDSGSLGVHHGGSMIEEFRLFFAAGFPIQETVQCATSNSAKLLGLKDAGWIGPGAEATFLAVKQDPTHLPESLKEIEMLWIRGRPHTPPFILP